MILYHGSSKTVEVPQYGFGSKENDYGLGFYCTQSNDLAKEWACPTVQSGFSNKYELDMDGLRVLYLNSDGYHILNWIAILLQNRIFSKRSPVARQANNYILQEFLPDISGYDVVVVSGVWLPLTALTTYTVAHVATLRQHTIPMTAAARLNQPTCLARAFGRVCPDSASLSITSLSNFAHSASMSGIPIFWSISSSFIMLYIIRCKL